ncbi:MAG: MFS transporter [Negativicutes bacterium]|nr:MFS transporter [Negativicutes bacterium]
MNRNNDKSFLKFIIVWIGQLVSSIGGGLTAFTLGVYAYEKTQTATSFALVTLFSFLPSILLRPIGGVLADRFDRRVMMIIGDIGSATGVAFIWFLLKYQGNIELWQIYLGVSISSIFLALQSPAYKASITDLLTEEQFAKASGLVQLASSAQYLVSPIVAGFLLSMTSIENILILDILTFIFAALAVVAIKKEASKSHSDSPHLSLFKDLKEGWEVIVCNQGVLTLILIISLVTFYIGFLQTLLGPMILSFSTPQTLGTILSTSALGMIGTSLYIGIRKVSTDYVRMLSYGLIGAGVFFALMGLSTNVYVITLNGFLFFCALPFINTSTDVLIRKSIPNEKQGRAWGIIGVLSQIGFIVAYGVAGYLADRIFNPLLVEGGILTSTIGQIIGVGNGRGIGLLFIFSGLLVVLIGFSSLSLKNKFEVTKSR